LRRLSGSACSPLRLWVRRHPTTAFQRTEADVCSVVGRVAELAVVEAFLSSDNGADALAIVGGAGIGKSTLRWSH
jgi:hypothetical protein